MYKKLQIIVLVALCSFCFAQNQRFIYEYKFVPNKDEPSDIKEEMMVLETTKDRSHFFSFTSYKSDSIMRIDLENQLKTTGMINIKKDAQKGLVRYQISKNYPDFDVFLHTRMMMDRYKVAESREIKWKILNESKKVGDWQVQKAETDFAGRKWTAWFTTEIPIQDGPYKFHGLPGLIVQIEDATKSHQFELKGIQRLNGLTENIFNSKEISINQKQYAKVLKDYENDPTKGLKMMQMGSVVMKMADGTAPNMKQEEDNVKARIAKDNNRIEISLE